MILSETKCIDLVRRGCDFINQSQVGFEVKYVRKIEGRIDIQIERVTDGMPGEINIFFRTPPSKSIASLSELSEGNFLMFVDKKQHEKGSEFPEYGFFTTFLHEMIHVIEIFIYDDRREEYNHDGHFLRLADMINTHLYKIEGKASSYVRDDVGFAEKNEKKRYFMNPTPTLKAQELFEAFNQYPASKVKNLKLPIGPNSTLVRLGDCEGIEYASDKMIFKTDQKTGKRKKRTYIHSFTEHGKSPALYSNEDGTLLILYSSKNPIEITEAGII